MKGARADSNSSKKKGSTMKFEKPTKEMLEFFEQNTPGPEQGAEKRQMFGSPVRFVNGNMCIGLHNNHIILRLSEADRTEFQRIGGKIFEPMPGRQMREYVVVPQGMMLGDKKELKKWMERSLSFVASLPPKKK